MINVFSDISNYVLSEINDYIANSYKYYPDSLEHQEVITEFEESRGKGIQAITNEQKLIEIGRKLCRANLNWQTVNDRCRWIACKVITRYNWKIIKTEISLGEHWGWTKDGEKFIPDRSVSRYRNS